MVKSTRFERETEKFFILRTVPSKSNPNISYEIRTSKQDGKTYCTCPGWIHKARKSDGLCKHILSFKAETFEPIAVYKFDEFVSVKRGLSLTSDAEVSKNVSVRRK
jgi:hypothetical protein